MTYSSRTTLSGRSRQSEMYEFYEMRETLDSRPQENRLFERDPRNTIRMNRSRREDLGQRLSVNEELATDVQVLNHCFGDIERFVFRLQKAAESSREMGNKKKYSKDKRREAIYGVTGYYARVPATRDFTDIFQKMKLSINLLAKLKPHIHGPSSSELVHFLFTPLCLIFEASRDPTIRHLSLSQSAIAPMLTSTARQFLLDNLTQKEMELWHVLGLNWTMTSEEWKGLIPFYKPQFYDGWQPHPGKSSSVYGSNKDLKTAVMSKAAQARLLFQRELSSKSNECQSDTSSIYCRIDNPNRASRGYSFNGPILTGPKTATDKRSPTEQDNSFIDVHMFDKGFIEEQPCGSTTSTYQQHGTLSTLGEPSVTIKSIEGEIVTYSSPRKQSVLAELTATVKPILTREQTVEKTVGLKDHTAQQPMLISVPTTEKPMSVCVPTTEKPMSVSVPTTEKPMSVSVPTNEKPMSVSDQLVVEVYSSSSEDRSRNDPLIIDIDTSDFLQKLQDLGLKACEVIHDRDGGNTKELTLKKGDIVGLIDNSKNWWKVRNQEGNVGFAPYTILNIINENDHRLVYKL